MTRVLLIDDDVELSTMLRAYFQQEGFDTTAVHDGETGVSEALSGRIRRGTARASRQIELAVRAVWQWAAPAGRSHEQFRSSEDTLEE